MNLDDFAQSLKTEAVEPAPEMPVEEPVKLSEEDRAKLLEEIAHCEAQIARQQAEIDAIMSKAEAQQAAVTAWIEDEANAAAEVARIEKRTELAEKWDEKVNAAMAGPEEGIAACQREIEEKMLRLEG